MTRDRLQELKNLMRRDDTTEEMESPGNGKSTPLVVFSDHVREVKLEVVDLQRRVQDLKVLLTDSQQWLNEKASKLVSPVSVPSSQPVCFSGYL
ncbi:hypothetical protein RUM43_005655 [Polyplax serrata]|uniref:Uncharacterized protein n=1 Tax=Polyplax serrata TaxID=468196 RepID=A0AAN8S1M8_POLSC